jgi:benzoate-CoA ligase
VFDVLSAFRPTVFAATPSLYGQMVHDFRAQPQRPSCFESVRHAISGDEPLPATLARRIQATFAVTPLHGFCATGSLGFVLSNRPGEEREGSAGRPLAGVEARVVNDEGDPVAQQEIGALEVRGPTVAPDWVRPGDRFFVDDDGFYFHCGRSDDLFQVSGRWLAPDEVERTLLGHPAVWECAVVEGHDEDGLARPVAFVVPNVGHAPSRELAIELMDYVKREIAPYKFPREVQFVDALPKSKSGRILRWQLRRIESAGGDR